jgi:hypothetical protein
MVVFQTAKLRRGVRMFRATRSTAGSRQIITILTTSSVFRAADQPPTRSALLTPNWRGCEGTSYGPQLVTWGKSTILSVDAHGFKFEYTMNSAKHIPFDWGGP